MQVLDDGTLEDSVGRQSALRLGLAEPSLEPGSDADLVLMTAALTSARSNDVALVVVGGVPRVARPDFATRLGPIAEHGKELRIGNVVRWTNEQEEYA